MRDILLDNDYSGDVPKKWSFMPEIGETNEEKFRHATEEERIEWQHTLVPEKREFFLQCVDRLDRFAMENHARIRVSCYNRSPYIAHIRVFGTVLKFDTLNKRELLTWTVSQASEFNLIHEEDASVIDIRIDCCVPVLDFRPKEKDEEADTDRHFRETPFDF